MGDPVGIWYSLEHGQKTASCHAMCRQRLRWLLLQTEWRNRQDVCRGRQNA